MPICRGCKEEVDELSSCTVRGQSRKLCEDCAEEATQAEALSESAEAAMRGMMEYGGRRD